MQITTTAIGRGVSRIGAYNVGYDDVHAIYSGSHHGWDVEIKQTNVRDERDLEAMVREFRKAERFD